MAWFKRQKTPLTAEGRRDLPRDVFDKCGGCGEILYRERFLRNFGVCPECRNHLRISAGRYVELLADPGSFEEANAGMTSADPLGFADRKPYPDRLEEARRKTGRNEAVVAGRCRIEGIPASLAVMDFAFIGGSMGSVVGEKIARAGRCALKEETPLVIVSASGGARMMEGAFSLMQMAKTSAVLARLHERALPYVSILTDPTTGGVTASYAMLGDFNLAEPGALIGFAGPRVIEETIKQALPPGFQSAEFLEEHGMVDSVVDRRELKSAVGQLLRHSWAGWKPRA